MTSTSQITVAELVSLDSNRGINFTGPYPPTYNGANFGVGATGANGLNNATVFMYASTDTSTPPLTPVSVLTYAFATGLVTGSSGAWATQFPTDNKPYRWVIKYVAVSANATYDIQPSDWSAASLMSKDGTPGYNIARLYIYQRVTEGQTPSPPNADATYTFSTNELTGLTNGWLYLIPLGSDPLWISSATATSYSATDVITPVEWSNPVILVKNGANGAAGSTGIQGNPGDKSVTVNLYYWSTTQPPSPSGTTTYTWATGVHSGNVGSWTTSVQTNAGTPGLKLWSVTKTITVPYNSVASSVSWSGDAVSPISQNGIGFRSVEASVFKWSASLPTGPIGTGTYDWTDNSLTADPSSSPGWHMTPNNSDMAAGFTLWKASVFLQDSQAATQTSFDWASATSILAIGYAGTQGPAGSTDIGAQGASARIAYKKYSAGTSPSGSPDPYTIAGDNLPPANTWDSTGVSWSTSVPTLGANEFLYQTNGVYNPATTQTAWGAPYQTSFKVGSLSALSANLGTITSGNLTLDTSGFIRTAGASYGSGSGIWMGYTGGTYKISIGGLTYDGTTLSVPAASITGQLNAGQINTNGLTIRDASGNVIIGAGASVNPSSYISVPAGWQNSNISLSSTGALTSGGDNLGSVTASGLGAVKTDLTNAPAAIQNSQITLTQSGNTYSLTNAGSGASISITGLGYTGALNATSDISLTNRNNCTIYGNRIVCNAASSWSGAAFSPSGNIGGAYATAMTGRIDKAVMFGLSTDPTNGVLDWPRISYGWYLAANGTCYTVVSGTLVAADSNNSTGVVYSVTYDGSKVRWIRNGTNYREVALSYTGPFYFDSAFPEVGSELTGCGTGPLSSNSWSAIGGSGKPQDNATVGATLGSNVYDSSGAVVSSDSVKNNLIDLGWWKPNASIPWGQNGELNTLGTATNWAATGDPKGGSDTVWYCREVTGDGGGGGGWNSPDITLDPSKTYRFVVPVKKVSGDGAWYWGTSNVCDLNTTSFNSNPYFVGGHYKSSVYSDRWYLLVGFVYPYNQTGFTHAGAGVIDCSTGLYVAGGVNYNFSTGGTVNHRAYQYYTSGTGAETLFGRPIINLVDGTEPALSNFFSSTAMLNQSISVSGGAITGIGTGSGTIVDNTSIGISSGNITGIGAGNGTAVANSNITVSNSSNSYTINGIGSSGSISIGGLGYTGDLDATRGAPAGTPVSGNFPSGSSAATVEASISTALTRGQNALDNRLAKATADTLTGPISLNAASAILVGTTNDGLYLGNTGIVGRKAGVTTFAVDQAGNATFAGTLAANIVNTNNLIIGSVNASSTSVITGVSLVSGSASSFKSGTMTGPTLTLTGRPVRGTFSGNITIFNNGDTSLTRYQISYSFLLVRVSNSSYLTNMSSANNVLMKIPSGASSYFEVDCTMDGIMAASTYAEPYRLDLLVSVYATDTASNSALNVVTRIDGYGTFSLNELKV